VYKCNNNFATIPLPEGSDKITLNLLLSHFSGIEHYSNGPTNPVPPIEILNNP
jgi:hypothetical protein